MEKFCIRKRLQSFVYACRGVDSCVKKEHNTWIHFGAAVLVIILGFILDISRYEWIAIILCIGMVFTTEIINTAIERTINLVSPEYNKLAGDVKDIAAGAVLISAISAAIVGLLIFVPKILLYL